MPRDELVVMEEAAAEVAAFATRSSGGDFSDGTSSAPPGMVSRPTIRLSRTSGGWVIGSGDAAAPAAARSLAARALRRRRWTHICFDFCEAHFPLNPAARIASGTLKTPSHANTSFTAFATRASSAGRFPPFPDMLVT